MTLSDRDKTLAFIPARGGSKRLPGKNVVDFFGRPIIAYTIEAALECRRFARVVVSSDDREILDVAQPWGAELVERPAELGSDTTRVVDVCLDFLDKEAASGRDYETLCCLYPCAPMREASDIASVLDLLSPGECDFAAAVTSYDLPPQQALLIDTDSRCRALFPDHSDLNESDIGTIVVDNGSTYAVSTGALRREHSFLGPGLRAHYMPRERSTDINVLEDLALARYRYQNRVQ